MSRGGFERLDTKCPGCCAISEYHSCERVRERVMLPVFESPALPLLAQAVIEAATKLADMDGYCGERKRAILICALKKAVAAWRKVNRS
jgi:hypothetical protein